MGRLAGDFSIRKRKPKKFILDTKRKGLVDWAELAVEEKHVLGVIRQSQKYGLLLEAWRRFEEEGDGEVGKLTVQELVQCPRNNIAY